MIKRLTLAGTGGYGVKFLGTLLGKVLMLKGFNVVVGKNNSGKKIKENG